MAKSGKLKKAIKNSTTAQRITLVAVLIFVVFGCVWYRSVYMSPRNVFWGMIDNNLATESVTRHVVRDQGGQTLDQYMQLQFGSSNSAHNLISVKQSGDTGENEVKSETIGTPKNDYSRYVTIKTPQKTAGGQPIDTSKLVNVWAKTDDSKAGQPSSAQYFQQSILGIVPYANLNYQQRYELVKLMQDKKAYDFSGEQPKSEKLNGRAVYVYAVSISPKAYIEMLQKFTKYMGLGEMGLDPSQYEGAAPLKVEMTVGKLSRQLLKIKYVDGGQEETYSAQGLEQAVGLPSKTIPISELQDRIQKSMQ